MFLYVVGFAAGTIFVGLLGVFTIQARWLAIIAIFVIFLALVGKRVTTQQKDDRWGWEGGRWEGILIDPTFKMTLSRLQLLLWTILALSAFAVIGLDRIIPVLQGQIPVLTPILATATQTPPASGENQPASQDAPNGETQEEPYEPLNIQFPEELLVAMGISTASLAGASIIKSNRSETKSRKTVDLLDDQIRMAGDKVTKAQTNVNEQTAKLNQLATDLAKQKAIPDGDPQFAQAQLEIARMEQEIVTTKKALDIAETTLVAAQQESQKLQEGKDTAKGDLHTNDNLSQADWSDLFRGDLVSNFQVVDVAKVQMFFFTIVLIFTYGVLIWGLLGNAESLRMNVVELPAFSSSLNALLGLSHAGYLVVKQTGS